MQQFLSNSFRGQEHDLRMVFDLLDEIRFPSRPAWVGMNGPGEVHLGIETIIANLEVGKKKEANIPFDNGLVGELSQYLERNQPGDWAKEIVPNAYEYALNAEQFLKSLERTYKNTFADQTRKYIRQVFPLIRTEDHTFRAIYRLAILGVVADYTYDYNARVVTVQLVRLRDGDATENLKRYLARYVSREAAALVPKEVHQEDGLTELRKAAKRLIRFVYDKIRTKRQQALDTIVRYIEDDVAEKTPLKDNFTNYFDSRFIEVLRPFTREYSSETVADCLKITVFNGSDDAAPHEMNHLRGSCDRLLVENPQNAAFHILRAFTLALNPAYAETDVIQELEEGLMLFRSQEDWNTTKEQELLTQLLGYVRASDESRIGPFGAALVRSHVGWMREFTAGIEEGEVHAGA